MICCHRFCRRFGRSSCAPTRVTNDITCDAGGFFFGTANARCDDEDFASTLFDEWRAQRNRQKHARRNGNSAPAEVRLGESDAAMQIIFLSREVLLSNIGDTTAYLCGQLTQTRTLLSFECRFHIASNGEEEGKKSERTHCRLVDSPIEMNLSTIASTCVLSFSTNSINIAAAKCKHLLFQ